jgi:Bacterial EndoU nuclease
LNTLPTNSKGVISVPSTYKVEIARFKRTGNGQLKLPKEFDTYAIKNVAPPDVHTFFPFGTSYEDIIEQFATALTNKTFTSRPTPFGLYFEAIAENGITFGWYENAGKIDTFFPKP